MKNKKEFQELKEHIKFSKEKICNMDKYRNRRDLLSVILEDKTYELKEVDNMIDKFMKGGRN